MRYVLGVLILSLAVPAFATQWIWDQLSPLDAYGGASFIDTDTPADATTADDFLCDQTGNITQMKVNGWSAYGETYLESFRVTFYADVPGTTAAPGAVLYQQDNIPFTSVSTGYTYEYTLNLPAGGFYQTGTPTAPIRYWVAVEGRMVADGFYDAWYWTFKERHAATYGAPAAFQSVYFSYPPWYHWAFPTGYADPDLFTGAMPAGWTAADMAFKLIGDKVPEPASLVLIGLAGLLIRRR